LLYKTLTGDRLLTALIIFLIFLGIWIPAFLSPEIVKTDMHAQSMPLFKFLTPFIEGNLLMSKILAFGLVMLEAVLLVRINAKYILVQQKTFLPALFFIIISANSDAVLQWNPVLPAGLFLILVLDIIFRSYKDEPNSYKFFEAGILLGVGSLFYAPLVYMLVFIWISAMVQRTFYWREYIFPLLGFLVPWVFVFAFLFLGDKSIPEFTSELLKNFEFGFSLPEIHWIHWFFTSYIALLILLSSVYLLKVFQFRKIYVRDYFMVFFWLFISASLIYLFLSGANGGISYFMAIPVSYILTNYFINARKSMVNKVLFYLLIGYALFMAVGNFLGLG